MKGPVHVDEILREMQHGAFSPGVDHTSSSSRIEIVSNASDSDISELPDDASISGMLPPPPVATTAAGRGRGRGRGKRSTLDI
jgi:hypothetical protein